MKQDQPFLVGQKAFIEKDGKVLVLFNDRNQLDFPGGKIQEGENDFSASLLREVAEETMLTIAVSEPVATWSFELPEERTNAGMRVFLVGYACKIIGGELKLSNEHLKYEWITKAELPRLNDGSGHFHALEKYFEKR